MKRKLDDLGRISVPKGYRDEIGLENGNEANIELEDNKIIITNPNNNKFDLKSYLKDKMQEAEHIRDAGYSRRIYQDIYDKCFK